MSKSNLMVLDSIFGFGKYEGSMLVDLIDTNIEYVLWCIHHDIISVDSNTMELINSRITDIF